MTKKAMTLRLDDDLLKWYQGLGAGYQSIIQRVLRDHQRNTGGDMSKSRAPKGSPYVEPAGPDAGPVLVEVDDVVQGKIRLEQIDCPLYDTQVQTNPYTLPKNRRADALERPLPILFFNSGMAGRSDAYTNLYTCGQLSWPKKFDASGIEMVINDLIELKDLVLRFHVGEVVQKTIPLLNMKIVEDRKRKTITCSSPVWNPTVHIPSVQHFRVELSTGEQYLGDTEVRCTLLGKLSREIV
jgi:hypothetical protein